jgi:YhcH/YjgK/YiaL family protein
MILRDEQLAAHCWFPIVVGRAHHRLLKNGLACGYVNHVSGPGALTNRNDRSTEITALMILDTIAKAGQYKAITRRFASAFDFINGMSSRIAVGRHDVDGENVYAIVQKYTTRGNKRCQLEAHKRYIDIQYLYAGREIILWAPLSCLGGVATPYNDTNDAALYGFVPTARPLRICAGEFAILFPEDAHAPGCMWGAPCEVTKVVVKVRVSEGR